MNRVGYACLALMGVASLGVAASQGPLVSGTVWFDRNGNGRHDAGEGVVAGMLVSDGYGFAETDGNGRYELRLHPRATTLHVQCDDRYHADVGDFWLHVAPGRKTYDFLMERSRPVTGPVTVIQAADEESDKMGFALKMRRYIDLHPEVTLCVFAGDLANGSSKGIISHLNYASGKAMGRPSVFVCGNHDNDFRLRWDGAPADPYLKYLGPWWRSFIHGGYLFVAAPMYNSWGAPLLYDMKDFGDYLAKLCERYPKHRKVLLCHDMPDLVGYSVATHGRPVTLDAAGFTAILYGHKHMNIVKKYPSGRRAWCVAPPNKGGSGSFPPTLRITRLSPAGGGESQMIYCDAEEVLRVSAPVERQVLRGRDGRLQVLGVAYNGVDEVVSVKARIGGQSVELAKAGRMNWSGEMRTASTFGPLVLEASTVSGRKLSTAVDFDGIQASTLKWVTELKGDTALADPLLVGQRILVALCDDEKAERGGVCALDAATGNLLWRSVTGYGIRNNMATDGHRVFAIDTRANVHAFNLETGAREWINESDPSIVSPSASGLICADGTVVAGYGRHLRGMDASDGSVRWRNRSWPTEERTPAEDKMCVVGDGTVLILSRLNGLMRHEIGTGRLIWQHRTFLANGTAMVDGQDVWLVGASNQLMRLRLRDGVRVSGTRAIPCGACTSVPTKLSNGLILIGSGNRGLGAVDGQTLRQRWRFLPEKGILATGDYITGHPQAVTATPAVDGDEVWLGCNDGILYCLDGRTGRIRRRFQIGASLLSRCILTEDTVMAVDVTGRVFAFKRRL